MPDTETPLQLPEVHLALEEGGDEVEDARAEKAEDGLAEAQTSPCRCKRESKCGSEVLSGDH